MTYVLLIYLLIGLTITIRDAVEQETRVSLLALFSWFVITVFWPFALFVDYHGKTKKRKI